MKGPPVRGKGQLALCHWQLGTHMACLWMVGGVDRKRAGITIARKDHTVASLSAALGPTPAPAKEIIALKLLLSLGYTRRVT